MKMIHGDDMHKGRITASTLKYIQDLRDKIDELELHISKQEQAKKQKEVSVVSANGDDLIVFSNRESALRFANTHIHGDKVRMRKATQYPVYSDFKLEYKYI